MRVLLTSTSYPRFPEDWRGVFIRHLAGALAGLPDVSLRVWAPPGPLPAGAGDACLPAEAAWLDALAQRGGIAQVLRRRSLASVTTPLRLMQLLHRLYRRTDAELVHANWLQSALPLRGTRTPVVVSVLGTDFALLKLPGMVAALRHVLRQRNSVIAPNAEWMAPALTRHFGDIARIRPVPFGVDDRWYEVQRREVAQAPRKWLAVLRVTRAKIGSLFDWGEGIFGRDDELHLFGPQQEPVAIPPWVHYHGATHPAQLAGEWMPQAAGLVTLSAHDEGRPQVLLEAMAAGLPVIASKIPGHEGLGLDGGAGLLVSSRDEFAAAIAALGERPRNLAMGEAGRARMRGQAGTWSDCAQRYLALYREVLA